MIVSRKMEELVRFCLVGGICFLVDYGLLYVCTEHFGIYYLYSSAIAFSVSVVLNYWLCLRFVFSGAKASQGSGFASQTAGQAALFIGSSIAGLGLNQLCMWLFVSWGGIHYMLAKILATIVVTAWNYVMKRRAVYGKGK